MSNAASPYDVSDGYRLALLIDALTEYAIYTVDANGFVTSWNAGAQNATGYRSIEIVGQHFSRFFTAEDQQRSLPARLLQEAGLSGRAEDEGWRLRKDGSRFWVTSLLQPLRDPAGAITGFALITRDITERQAAQQALSESESRFRLLVEGVIDYALYMLDPSGIIINWNAGAQRLKGYTAAEIVGQHFSRFYTREDRAAGLPARMLETAARDGRFETEGWHVRKDGSRFWAWTVIDAIRNDKGELLGFAKVTRDITERQAAQEALRESERQFRLLVNSVTDYALFMLDPNGIVTSWNAGAQRIKGYAAEEIIGQHFSRFYTERDRLAGFPGRALHAAATEGRFEAEGWRVRRDGSLFWANVVIDPVKDENGTLIGFAKITRDISERRESQIALEKARVQRDHAQRMEALGQLTGGVAHDFNNLLMVISGHIDTLKRLAGQDSKAMQAVDAVARVAVRGESLTRQLLTFSRRQSLKPVVVVIAERIAALEALMASSLGASVRLATHIAPDIWPVRADVGEFELALVNILLNARDAMPEGGLITIAAENVVLRPADTPQDLNGEFVALTIADTGIGIAADILPKVFDPFFTTKRSERGSGLGLSQVHGFAHQSGGTVVVQSELGQGTRVTLYLPRAHEAPERSAEEKSVELSQRGRALLVEDNPDVAEATAAMLGQLGYDVDMVENADQALEAMARQEFDLVISDIVMSGGMDGFGLARALRGRHPHLPILLVTGYSNAPADAEAAFIVLRKPYRLAELSRAAAKAVAASRAPPDNLVHLPRRGGPGGR